MKSTFLGCVLALLVVEAVHAANPTACDASIANCKKDYQGLQANSTQKDKCEKLGKALGCQNSMIKSLDCMGLTRTPDHALVVLYGQDCGNNAACDTAIDKCKKDYAGLSPNSPIADKCEKVGKAVGCISAELQSTVCTSVGRQASVEDAKLSRVYSDDCGNATACETGVNACLTNDVKGIIGDPDSAKNTDCPIIKQAVNCLDIMRKKTICRQAQHALLEGEKSIRQSDAKICGGSGSGGNGGMSIQGSVVATLVIALLCLIK